MAATQPIGRVIGRPEAAATRQGPHTSLPHLQNRYPPEGQQGPDSPHSGRVGRHLDPKTINPLNSFTFIFLANDKRPKIQFFYSSEMRKPEGK